METKPSLWADLLLCGWVVVVAVFFFGPSLFPIVGTLTPKAAVFPALMTLICAVTLALKFLRRPEQKK